MKYSIISNQVFSGKKKVNEGRAPQNSAPKVNFAKVELRADENPVSVGRVFRSRNRMYKILDGKKGHYAKTSESGGSFPTISE